MQHSLALVASIVVGFLIKGRAALAGYSINWAWALALGFALVYGGWLIPDENITD